MKIDIDVDGDNETDLTVVIPEGGLNRVIRMLVAAISTVAATLACLHVI